MRGAIFQSRFQLPVSFISHRKVFNQNGARNKRSYLSCNQHYSSCKGWLPGSFLLFFFLLFIFWPHSIAMICFADIRATSRFTDTRSNSLLVRLYFVDWELVLFDIYSLFRIVLHILLWHPTCLVCKMCFHLLSIDQWILEYIYMCSSSWVSTAMFVVCNVFHSIFGSFDQWDWWLIIVSVQWICSANFFRSVSSLLFLFFSFLFFFFFIIFFFCSGGKLHLYFYCRAQRSWFTPINWSVPNFDGW